LTLALVLVQYVARFFKTHNTPTQHNCTQCATYVFLELVGHFLRVHLVHHFHRPTLIPLGCGGVVGISSFGFYLSAFGSALGCFLLDRQQRSAKKSVLFFLELLLAQLGVFFRFPALLF